MGVKPGQAGSLSTGLGGAGGVRPTAIGEVAHGHVRWQRELVLDICFAASTTNEICMRKGNSCTYSVREIDCMAYGV